MKNLFLIFGLILIFTSATVESQAQVRIERSRTTTTISGKDYWLHRVNRGETLYALAAAYKVTEQEILDRNPFLLTGKLQAKQVILIPCQSSEKDQENHESMAKIASPVVDSQIVVEPIVEIDEEPSYSTPGLVREFDPRKPLQVAMMMPFKGKSNRQNDNFVDFYRGTLLALNSLKSEGISVNLQLLASEGSAQSAEAIAESGVLDGVSLIIGPVYDVEFEPIARYANLQRVPIVSPLATTTQDSPYIFQAAPSDATKYDKLRVLLADPQRKIILLKHQQTPDKEFIDELQGILPEGQYQTVNYSRAMAVNEITDFLATDRINTIIVAAGNEGAVEDALSRLSSMNVMQTYRIEVIGNGRWSRYNNLNADLLFRLNAYYITSYHADRDDVAVADFYKQYVSAFGALPNLFSFRGYDVTRFFVTALKKYGIEMPLRITEHKTPLLQVDYRFQQDAPQSKFINREWMLVGHKSDYSIDVK